MSLLKLTSAINLGIIVALLTIAISVCGYSSALTAANTVPDGQSGDGAGLVNPFTISNYKLATDVDDPLVVGQIKATISPATASHVLIRVNGVGNFYNCTALLPVSACSTTPPLPSNSFSSLRMVAVE